jgi:hypothetical protein
MIEDSRFVRSYVSVEWQRLSTRWTYLSRAAQQPITGNLLACRVINLKTPGRFGLSVSPILLALANEVSIRDGQC